MGERENPKDSYAAYNISCLVTTGPTQPSIHYILLQTVINYMWFGRTLAQAVDDPRLHHQLVPMYVQLDRFFKFDPEIVDGLKGLGHAFNKTFLAVVQAVARGNDGLLYGKSDPRKGGHSAGF